MPSYLLFVEGVLANGRHTAGVVEVMAGRQSTQEQQSSNTQRIEHLDEGCDFSPEPRQLLYSSPSDNYMQHVKLRYERKGCFLKPDRSHKRIIMRQEIFFLAFWR
jgi:hypothetical protein